MFHQQHGGAEYLDQPLDLHAGEHIDIVKGFVPDIQMRRRNETGRNQNFLFLAFGILRQVLVKLQPLQIQLSKQGQEQAVI